MARAGFAVIFCLGISILWFIYTYNRFKAKQLQIDSWWDEVDMHLKIRHDLIPDLIAKTKLIMGSETPTLDRIASIQDRILEESFNTEDEIECLENELSNEMHSIQLSFKERREAQMDENLLTVMSELASIEGRASSACAEHNKLVNDFNTSITRFPASIVLNFLHFHPKEKRIFGISNSAHAAQDHT
ncbi:MAG: LemA family protein [Synergistaceae bacterium]|nr:LemA family protein [Synergistaceae bacterium]